MKYPHQGHRQRLKGEFENSGFLGWDDAKILEYMLFYAVPRSDTSPIAKRLLKEYGSLRGVMEAPSELLEKTEGVGKNTAFYIKALNEYFHHCSELKSNGKIYLTSGNVVESYFREIFKNHRRESFYVICVDARGAAINKILISEGAFDASEIDVGKIVRAAVSNEAAGVILAHNHPGGSLEPSGVDITATQIIKNSLQLIGVTLCEHYIVTDEGVRGFIDRINQMENKKNIQKYAGK